MAETIRSVRGINDVLPDENPAWARLERVASETFATYGYDRIRTPIMEHTPLFERGVGEATDIVEKEMYTFTDRSGDSLTLRPEGTAGVVRAGVEHGLFHNATQRFWYSGPMFRHERPQKGRYRQFHQFGVEAFGQAGPDVDIEQIAMSARLFARLGITGLELQLNTLGTPEERTAYRQALQTYFSTHRDRLDSDSLDRLDRNPLRILDSKNPDLADLIADAPTLDMHLSEASRNHFDTVCAGLTALGIDYRLNPRLVRGLDYYTRTVFEWVTTDLGSQDAVCSGGRFDGLVGRLGGHSTPATGFALGSERLIQLMEAQGVPGDDVAPHAYVIAADTIPSAEVTRIAEWLRDVLPSLRLRANAGGGSFKSQFKRADRCGARLALILGEAEVEAGRIGIKPLTDAREQTTVELADAPQQVTAWLDELALD
ncbi:histidine--tRNA ligase [Salinisphaera sp. USBA-960]|uniref:histidine--tRNA ligase n=1 Tax=Salinisphaera orenii TaxID=856731 RepID=UPI000DBE8C00|nr:histidine--tRNA ligase [Salifodinibacter halophilus]NNC25775.1 histidine--tRNA ligase [Salifodinibacter halophilus]